MRNLSDAQACNRSCAGIIYTAEMSGADRNCWRVALLALLLAGSCFAQSWGSVGVGYSYLLTETGTGNWTSSHNWYALPTFNINNQIGIFADFTNFYSKG